MLGSENTMGIKVEIVEAKTHERPFPKLMMSDSGDVLLATSSFAGTIKGVLISSETEQIGFWSSSWLEYKFKDFDGSITLSNE